MSRPNQSPAENKEKPKVDPFDPTVELGKLRALLAGKSMSVVELNDEQKETLSEIDKKRMETATLAIQKRHELSLGLAA